MSKYIHCRDLLNILFTSKLGTLECNSAVPHTLQTILGTSYPNTSLVLYRVKHACMIAGLVSLASILKLPSWVQAIQILP